MAKDLSPARRSALRGEAHKLKPVVIIGDKGLTDEVLAEIDRSLRAHELIKVRANGERDARDVWLETICGRLGAHPVQQIGKIFVIYREKPEELDPGPSSAEADARGDAKRRPKVTERGKQAQRARDAEKQRQKDIVDMKRKGKIPANAATGSARPRARTQSPIPESGPRRRRPRTPG